jgi:hypothetical protein
MFYFYSLKWLPQGYNELIKEAMSLKSFSITDFKRRLRAVRQIWHETVPKIEKETKLTPDQISRYYVEKKLHQTSMLPRQ